MVPELTLKGLPELIVLGVNVIRPGIPKRGWLSSASEEISEETL